MMHIAFNTDELTAEDRKVLALLAGNGDWPSGMTTAVNTTTEAEKVTPAKAAPAKKATPAKAAPVVEATPEPEPEPEPEAAPEEDLLGGEEEAAPEGPTMADAVAAATKLVSSGGAPKVKTALAAVGAKRVSEIPADKIAEFLTALA